LEAGARRDAKPPASRTTPLGVAAKRGQLECLSVLLDHGADPNPALKPALQENHAAALAHLLDRGADALGGAHGFAPVGRIALTPRLEAISCGYEACVTALAGRGPYGSLSDAVADGNIAAVRKFWQAGSALDERDSQGRRPIHWALRAGQLDAVRWLMERGVVLDQPREPTSAARNAVWAVHRGREVLEFLRSQGVRWDGALRSAVNREPRPAVLAWLVEHATFDAQELAQAVRELVTHDHVEGLEILAARGVDVDHSGTGEPPDLLRLAAASGAVRAFDLLLARGADPHATFEGNTVLDAAIESADRHRPHEFLAADLELPIVQRLLTLGAKSKFLPK
jgi:ankyrin repeat protein